MNSFKNNIEQLPDYMKIEDIEMWFLLSLQSFEKNLINKDDLIFALYNLADRQWHTYEYLSPHIKEKIENCIINIWEETFSFIDAISGTVAMLGLERVYLRIISLKKKEGLNVLVNDIINEYGESVSDPYSSLR